VFDLSLTKIAVLLVLAVVIFGPDQLPKVAAQAGRTLRELRRLADGARRDLAEGLGPEFGDFDIADLNPRTFVRKHLLDEFEADPVIPGPESPYTDPPYTAATPHSGVTLSPGESPPYDSEAT
jgi:sec-independent protein translocase protein TatB